MTEEGRKNKKIFPATGSWVVLRFLLWRHMADIYARNRAELGALTHSAEMVAKG